MVNLRGPAGNEESSRAGASRIAALVRLLGDDDSRIAALAWSHLERLGDAALVGIREAAHDSPEPRVRVKARVFLAEYERRVVFRRWVEFCRRGADDLEEGAFLIVRSEYPRVDPVPHHARLDSYGLALRSRLARLRTREGALERFVGSIHGSLHFRGSRARSADPDDTYLHRVLDRGIGTPASLGTVYLLLARRAGLPLAPVGFPERFLLKYERGRSAVFIDAFERGRRLSPADCAAFLEASGIPFDEGYLEAVGDREVLRRTLGELIAAYRRRGDRRRLERVSAMARLLE